jgi:hypothetical protein
LCKRRCSELLITYTLLLQLYAGLYFFCLPRQCKLQRHSTDYSIILIPSYSVNRRHLFSFWYDTSITYPHILTTPHKVHYSACKVLWLYIVCCCALPAAQVWFPNSVLKCCCCPLPGLVSIAVFMSLLLIYGSTLQSGILLCALLSAPL